MNTVNQDARLSVTFESVTMDSRKFLSTINNSAQSQLKIFEEAVSKLGASHGAKWKLASLNNGKLVIEDINTGEYYIADHTQQKNRTAITNIKKLNIADQEKGEIFESACKSLIDAIENGDPKNIESAYNRISAQRFRSTVVPNSGLVKTRDGVIRHISVRKDKLDEEKQSKLVARIVECVSDRINISEGKVEGSFNTEKLSLPVSKLTSRRVVAYRMKNTAANAYYSNNFQTLAESTASLICKDELDKAVDVAAKFLKEHQEFSLLNTNQMHDLISNALATRGIFNENLIRDTALLFRKVNCEINKADIINAWRNTAKVADHPVMMENVALLESAPDFNKAYDKFLSTIFEAVGETSKAALLNGLKMLKDKVGDQDQEVSTKIDDLIGKLSNSAGADDQAVWDAMDLLARVNDDLDAANNLNDFDKMPNSDKPSGPPISTTPPNQGAGTGTVININTSGGTPVVDTNQPSADVGADTDVDDTDLGDLNLDDLDLQGSDLGKDEKEPALNLDDVQTDALPLNENDLAEFNKALEAASEFVDFGKPAATPTNSDSYDEFMLPEGIEVSKIDHNYGMPILNEYALNQKVAEMDKMISDKKIDPKDVQNQIDEIAGAILAGDSALKDPKSLEKAKAELIGAYSLQQAKDSADSQVIENQIKSPVAQLSRRGLKKSAINALVTEGKFEWVKREGDGVLGVYKDTHFVLDHAEPPVILSLDGKIEIPIPESLVPGALYFAEVTETESDADDFVEWLDKNINQLKPLNEADQKAIAEAVAKLTVSPDVKVEIQTDAGTDVPVPPVISEPSVSAPVDKPFAGAETPEEEAAEHQMIQAAIDEVEEDGDDDVETDEDDDADESDKDEDLEESLSRVLDKPIENKSE